MKKESKSKGPEFIRFLAPIIAVLKELGGSGNAGEVVDAVIEKMDISDEELKVVNKNGGSRIKNQVNWGRMYLVNYGAIDNSKRGIWSLTEKGEKLDITTHEQAYAVIKSVQELFKDNDNTEAKHEDESVTFEENAIHKASNYKEQLLTILRNLPPSGFEKICQRLLRESGFMKVKVTGKTGDNGIDGEGILAINPLLTFKVLFQCKRYKADNIIGSSIIRDFRGAMQGRADKGIILTTSFFSKDAKQEAIRDGVPPIELVDADSIIELFESKELGLKPIKAYEIEEGFFTEYKNG